MAKPKIERRTITESDCEGWVLEPRAIDVKRLRDDHSPIFAGDQVMFVGVAKFSCARADGLGAYDVAVGDDVITIQEDGEVTSPLPCDPKVLAVVLAKRFTFKFTANGKVIKTNQRTYVPAEPPSDEGTAASSALLGPPKKDPPWILRLNTSMVDTDYVDVELSVLPSTLPAPAALHVLGEYRIKDARADASHDLVLKIAAQEGFEIPTLLEETFEHDVAVGGGHKLPLRITLSAVERK